jgi:hypothetical protein
MIGTDQPPTQAENRKLIDSLSFSVSARVAMQLGRESISSSITLNVFADVHDERQRRFHELLVKSLTETLSSEETTELDY